ncbi:MAG TPA: FtsX-like permease family protein, partial [Planctomycetota bacterium]|nr:FtsX-like permease family protein [Planctomycetota bacterium]
MRPALLLTLLRREARGQLPRLGVFCASLAVGVAAVVIVAGLAHGLDSAVRASARDLLAADVAVESRRALPRELDAVLARHPELRRIDVTELASLVAAPPAPDGTPGRSRLVEVKAVGDGFPFYGALVLDPPRPLSELLADDGLVCAPELLATLGLQRGDRLRLGGRDFTIAGEVRSEPDKLGLSFTLGPRVFVSHDALQRTALLGFGTTARHRVLLALPQGAEARAAEAVADEIAAAFPERSGARVQTAADAQPALRRGLSRVDGFLGLVALLSLLIGGIGVAQTVRAWLASRLQSLAVARCLGVRPRELLLVHFLQTAALGLLGSLAGTGLGFAALAAVPALAGDWLPAGSFSPWQPAAMARGLLLGLLVSLCASVPALLTILRVPPLAALRRDAVLAAAGRPARVVLAVLLLGGVFAAAWLQTRVLLQAAWFAGGLALVAGVLLLAARGAIAAVSRLPRGRGPLALRHGLSAIARPDAGTWGGVLALGMGVLVVVAMQLVQARLARELSGALPRDAPTAFLIDIQKDQWPGVSALLAAAGATHVESTPVITARLVSIDGRPVAGRSVRPRAADGAGDGADDEDASDSHAAGNSPTGDNSRAADGS